VCVYILLVPALFIELNKIFDTGKFIFFIHLFTCAYIVWVISPPILCPLPLPPHSSLPGRTCSALISNFVEEKT
jgi:hypothetical protein